MKFERDDGKRFGFKVNSKKLFNTLRYVENPDCVHFIFWLK